MRWECSVPVVVYVFMNENVRQIAEGNTGEDCDKKDEIEWRTRKLLPADENVLMGETEKNLLDISNESQSVKEEN